MEKKEDTLIKNNSNIINIKEKKDFFNSINSNSFIIFNENIGTLIIEGSNNFFIIQKEIITLVIEGNNNKIIFGIESLGMKNIIFKGNDNLIKIENCYSNVKVIDDGFYNKIFKKISNNEKLKIKIDVKKKKMLLKKKRIIKVNIEIQEK